MTSTSSKKVLVVFGATGMQGGSVARTALEDPILNPEYHVRAITRDPSKPSAKALADKGAELISADFDDEESLRKALKGAHSVFLVTNFWETARPEEEIRQGKHVADVAKELGIQHFIWSSLTGATELTRGRLGGVLYFDSKAVIENYIRDLGIPATYFLAGFYMSNLVPNGMFAPNPQFDGAYVLGMPTPLSAPFPLIAAAEDVGKFIKAILLNRDSLLGKRVLGAADYYTPGQMVEEFKEVKPEAGKTAQYFEIPDDAFKAYLGGSKGFFGRPDGLSDDLQEAVLQNFRLMSEGGYYGGESLAESHSILTEPLMTWKEFLAKSLPDVK